MQRRDSMNKLALHIFNSLFQVTQSFRLQPKNRPYMGRLNKYLVAKVNLIISTVLLNQIVKHMSSMTTMRRHTHTACQKDNSGLLSRNINATSPPLIASEITFTVSAEAAQITHRCIEGLIGFHQPHIPVS